MTEVQRCSGHCCKQFHIPVSPEELKKDHEIYLAWAEDQSKPPPHFKEIHIVGPMLIYIGRGNFLDGEFAPDENGTYFYTCKNHDVVTGDCKIYQNRPKMCSDYPYGGVCAYKGCTLRVCERKLA